MVCARRNHGRNDVPANHRRPGLAYAACMDRDLYAEIICDGHHVSYLMIELLFKLKGCRRSILITDSIEPLPTVGPSNPDGGGSTFAKAPVD
jgi:N-acetylglucosamine-6-phosphate deacetylase